MGTWDAFGRPNYLVTSDLVSTQLLSFIEKALPQNIDLRTTNPQLLTNPALADIVIKKQSDVFITFVSGETAWSNSIAFYTYPTGKPPATPKDIRTITHIFPNAGDGTTLKAGDKVKIGRFAAGISIGFVLLTNAWNTTIKEVDNTADHFYTTDALNPEVEPSLKRHAVFTHYTYENKTLIGFENINRERPDCNHDFNDLIFYASII